MTTEQTRQAGTTEEPVHTGWLASFRLDAPVARLLVWSGLALVFFTIIGFAWLMRLVPPPDPLNTAEQSLAWVQQNQTSMLIGAALCTFFWSFWVTWCAPLILYVRRMERVPLLTFALLANSGGGAAVITTIAVSWTVMAFRAENPLVVQSFHDFGWFMFLYTWPAFGIFMWCVAVAILRDVNPRPTFPRWVAYYNIYAGIAMAPASFMGLFKSGPLAFNGILSFWLVAIDFFLWMVIMSVVLLKAVKRDEHVSH